MNLDDEYINEKITVNGTDTMLYLLDLILKGLAQAKIIKKSVILFRVLNMTI